MPLDRTWVNGLVNDDGSNTVGELWDKADVIHIYDDVDAALVTTASASKPNALLVTTTGAITLLPIPSGTGDLTVFLTAPAPVAIHGIVAGVNGQRLSLLVFAGGTQVDLVHNSASAAAGTKLANTATSGATSLTVSGSATYVYDGLSALNWRLLAHEQGGWITPPYNAAEFAADVGTWTVDAGDVTYRKYKLQGRSLFYKLGLVTTSLSGAPSLLVTKVPGGFTGMSGEPVQLFRARNAPAAYLVGAVTVQVGVPTWLQLNAQIDGLAWTVSTNQTGVEFSIVIEVT